MQVAVREGSITYHLSVGGKDVFVPVQDPLTEVLKKLKGTLQLASSLPQHRSLVVSALQVICAGGKFNREFPPMFILSHPSWLL